MTQTLFPYPVGYADTAKTRTRAITKAFVQGANGRMSDERIGFIGGPAVFFGVTKNLKPIFDYVLKEQIPYYYIDNAYFGRSSYYRITKNAKQHKGIGSGNPSRRQALGITISPWRSPGRKILVTTQSEWWYELHGTTLLAWLTQTVSILRQHTDRPIQIRAKPYARTIAPELNDPSITYSKEALLFANDLDDVFAVVTHSSNTAVEAIVAGIPIFATSPDCAAVTMGSSDLTQIESPRRSTDRESWVDCLAANQWTLDEMRSGQAWREIG